MANDNTPRPTLQTSPQPPQNEDLAEQEEVIQSEENAASEQSSGNSSDDVIDAVTRLVDAVSWNFDDDKKPRDSAKMSRSGQDTETTDSSNAEVMDAAGEAGADAAIEAAEASVEAAEAAAEATAEAAAVLAV